MNDENRLNLKVKMDEQLTNLSDYSEKDVKGYPGWTFLLPNVVKEYSICSFLNVNDASSSLNNRIMWLESQSDRGQLYYSEVAYVTSEALITAQENEKENVKRLICERICELTDNIDLDAMLHGIRQKKEVKSQNRFMKEAWTQIMNTMNEVALHTGMDLSKYFQILCGYSIRYKTPEITTPDVIYNDLCVKYLNLEQKLKNHLDSRETMKFVAEQQLSNLIASNFHINQTGRYYKKWSSLTDEKKNNRILSFCDWYIRKNSLPIETVNRMYDWILEKLISKELRIMDIQWNSKTGIIENINVHTVHDEDTPNEITFENNSSVKVLRTAQKKPTKKRVSGEKVDIADDILEQIHRLLLYFIMKTQVIDKEDILKSVVYNVHRQRETYITDYISQKLNEMLEIVKSTPVE